MTIPEPPQEQVEARPDTTLSGQQQSRFLESLNRAAQALNASVDLEQILITLLEETRRLLDVTGISIWLLDEATGELVCHQCVNPTAKSIQGWRLAPGEGLASRALELQHTLVTSDVRQEPAHCKGPHEQLGLPVRSVLSVPLCSAKRRWGVLQAVDLAVNRFTPLDATILETLGASAVIAIENAQLYAQIQRELHEREQIETRLKSLFTHAMDAILLINDDFKFIDVNDAACALVGYTHEQLMQSVMWQLIPPDDLEDVHLKWRMLLQEGRHSGEVRLLCINRDIINADYTAVAHITPGLHLISLRDATQRKRLEEELIRNERLALVGHLAASVAHEINNPLQAVLGCLGLAQEALLQGREVTEYLQIARKEVRRISRIVNNMSDLYRIPSTEIRPVDVNVLVDEVLELTRKQCRDSHVEVHWRPARNLAPLLAIHDRLKQVCLNLLLNAIAAMPEGGRLEISTSQTIAPPGIRLRFSDTGHGISPEVQSRIFEPFFSTRPHGSGLGLTISRDIITQHGGHIEVESLEGQGATFTLWLPLPSAPG